MFIDGCTKIIPAILAVYYFQKTTNEKLINAVNYQITTGFFITYFFIYSTLEIYTIIYLKYK